MDIATVNEVRACLSTSRTLFHYYKDRYGIGLLRQYARTSKAGSRPALTVNTLKQSRFAPLVHKPRIKGVLAQLGGSRIDEAQLALHDYDESQIPFTLTLGAWGAEGRSQWRRKQTSRPGYNLVLQLNFCKEHDAVYRMLGAPPGLFNYHGHPASSRHNTLAWARIDFDWRHNAALIEEVQSDWVRRVAWLHQSCLRRVARVGDVQAPTLFHRLECPLEATLGYCEFVLARYRDIWAEAMLWAAIDFLCNEIGFDRIFYHSVESGRLLKNIGGNLPPQSLYTDLPRRFCFEPSAEVPAFLLGEGRNEKILKRHASVKLLSLALRDREGLVSE